MIEISVKNLYVDQHVEEGHHFSHLSDRLDFLEAKVGSSIDVLDELSLWAFHPSDAKQFKSEVYDAYRKACASAAVSKASDLPFSARSKRSSIWCRDTWTYESHVA